MILVAHGFGAELRQPAKIDRVIQDTTHRSVIPQMTTVANGIWLADQAVILVGRNGNVIRIQDICDRPDIVSRRPQLEDMHKLGEDAAELTRESNGAGAASLIMRTENGRRSFKVALVQPEGSSYAKDIAEKYGVTYDMLIGGDRKV